MIRALALILITAALRPTLHAQDLEPRAYSNSPTGLNFGTTGYNAQREHDFQAVGIAWQYRWGGGF